MRNYLCFFLSVFLFTACVSKKKAAIPETETGSIPGAQISLDESSLTKAINAILDSSRQFTMDTIGGIDKLEKPDGSLANCNDVPRGRQDLTSLKTIVKVFNGNLNAGMAVPGFGGTTLGRTEASYHVYYVEPKVVKCDTGTQVYGCGYSVHLLVKKIKKNISLAKLPVVAANVEVESNKTQVYYSLQTHGLTGMPLVKFFKPVVDKPFDVEGFGIMQSSIDGVHNVISDPALASQVSFKPTELKFIKAADLDN
ncbi:hypothetical protein [Longitalea arenae]|uniref:hypothetical protein n=1 Tax=Longitalea arenae TaxID=2812558 RepID=UPI001967AF6F|nr:hypothetical protein [Longitalea arenae]